MPEPNTMPEDMQEIKEIKELLKQDLRFYLEENVEVIQKIIQPSIDFHKRDFVFHGDPERKGVCFFTEGLVNEDNIQKVLKAMIIQSQQMEQPLAGRYLLDKLKDNLMINGGIIPITSVEEAVEAILSGDTVLLVDYSHEALVISTKGWDKRAVSEPETELVVRGPRDGFTEDIRTNTAHVRRRIKDPLLRFDPLKLGSRTRTDINIAYIKDLARDDLVMEVKERLKGIKVDSILESGYIEELIEDAPMSPFPTILSTERPDKVAAALLEGRIAIFVDNTPFVLLVPTSFWDYLQASDDYYSRYWNGSFFRVIRIIAFAISLVLPSIYVMLASFHQEMIPTGLAFTIASGREVVPFPVLLEALLMEIIFELMREAGLRMPKPVGSAVSIVGSLVIGQAGVQAGLVSPSMVIVVATTGIASFAIPNYAASFSIRVLRFPLLIASGTLGLLGFAAIFFAIAIHALSLRSFGVSYFSPATPFFPSDQKDVIFRPPWWLMDKRPHFAQGELRRQAKGQIPRPQDPEPASPTEEASPANQPRRKNRFGRRTPK